MFTFFKYHITYLTENAVNPDKRRYAIDGEAERHYIDIDMYGDSAIYKMPRNWNDAVAKYTEDTLQAYGIVPWHINSMKYRLTEAMKEQNARRILSLAADMGHYIGDAHVPLHTTVNYNGALNQPKRNSRFLGVSFARIIYQRLRLFYGSSPLHRPSVRPGMAGRNRVSSGFRFRFAV